MFFNLNYKCKKKPPCGDLSIYIKKDYFKTWS
jgi:hypothetical protein